METITQRTIAEQTGHLVKAMEYLLNAKEEMIKSLYGAYGEEQGSEMYDQVFEKDFEELMTTLSLQIGVSMQVNMGYINDNLY